MSLFLCQKVDITVICFFQSSGSGKKQRLLTPTKRLFISLSGSYPISRVIGFIATINLLH